MPYHVTLIPREQTESAVSAFLLFPAALREAKEALACGECEKAEIRDELGSLRWQGSATLLNRSRSSFSRSQLPQYANYP